MQKQVLISSLDKNFLALKGIDDYYVFLSSNGKKMEMKSYAIAYKSSVFSTLRVEGVDLEKCDVIVRNPKSLINILNIADEEILLSFDNKDTSKLLIKDGTFSSEFVLTDPSVIGFKLPKIDEPISYDVEIDVTQDFIKKYLKAKKANNTETVSVEVKDRKSVFVLGDLSSYSNKVSFAIEQEGLLNMDKVYFSSDIIEEVLSKNKTATGKLYVCEQGLMKIQLEEIVKDYKISTTYFLVALDNL